MESGSIFFRQKSNTTNSELKRNFSNKFCPYPKLPFHLTRLKIAESNLIYSRKIDLVFEGVKMLRVTNNLFFSR